MTTLTATGTNENTWLLCADCGRRTHRLVVYETRSICLRCYVPIYREAWARLYVAMDQYAESQRELAKALDGSIVTLGYVSWVFGGLAAFFVGRAILRLMGWL